MISRCTTGRLRACASWAFSGAASQPWAAASSSAYCISAGRSPKAWGALSRWTWVALARGLGLGFFASAAEAASGGKARLAQSSRKARRERRRRMLRSGRSGGMGGGIGAGQQDVPVHAFQARVAAEGHGQVQLVVDDLQRLADAGLAHRAQTVQHRAADVGAARAECPGFQHVLT